MVRVRDVISRTGPAFPPTAILYVPATAVFDTARLTVLIVSVVVGLKAMFTPFGKPSSDRLTSPLNPSIGATVIVVEPLVPGLRVRVLGDAERRKLGDGSIVTLIDVVAWRLPAIPLSVTVYSPGTVLSDEVRVNTLFCAAIANDASTPFGNPIAYKLTLSLKPFCASTVIVVVPPEPCSKVKLFGAAERLKLGEGSTVRVTVEFAAKLPATPATAISYTPGLAVAVAVRFSILCVPATAGLNSATIPLGNSVANNITSSANPFCAPTVIVVDSPAPWSTVRLLGEIEREKLGAAVAACGMDDIRILRGSQAVVRMTAQREPK